MGSKLEVVGASPCSTTTLEPAPIAVLEWAIVQTSCARRATAAAIIIPVPSLLNVSNFITFAILALRSAIERQENGITASIASTAEGFGGQRCGTSLPLSSTTRCSAAIWSVATFGSKESNACESELSALRPDSSPYPYAET